MAQAAEQMVEVVDETGAPFAGAIVVVERGTAPYPEIARKTGAQGTLKYALPDGEFELVAHAGDGRTGRGKLTVKDGSSRRLTLRLGSRA